MKRFLLFTLYAPLSSWGDIAVGEVRGSWDRPSRSAILGLVAAAMGVVREDEGAHARIGEGYGVAVRLDAPGTPLVDYHTAQTVPSAALRKGARDRPRTRAGILGTVGPEQRETILSRRTYRQDSMATIVLWERADPYRPLPDLVEALLRPAFVLYAGRKSNALGLPLGPQVVQANTLADALTAYSDLRGMAQDLDSPDRVAVHHRLSRITRASNFAVAVSREVAHDPCEGFASGLEPLRRELRRDTAPHRVRWQFMERTVEVDILREVDLGAGAGPAGDLRE